MDEETKKNQNIINIVREGQISLLVSLRASQTQVHLKFSSSHLPPPPAASPGGRQPGADQRRGQKQPAAHLGLAGSR